MAYNNIKLGSLKIVILSIILLAIFSCKINYSFTGASISPNIKTISIAFFPNYSTLVNPSLSQTFTEALKDKFVSQTSLELMKEDGDLQFSGEITDYRTTPAAITGDLASQTRLTITIKVKYVNTKDSTQDFEKSFSQYSDFPSSSSLDAVEGELVKEIIDKINDDIFNASVSNW
jgi:hypothetical protein